MLDHLEAIADKNAFERDVLQAPMPVLVDFYAVGCEDSRELAPIISRLAEDWGDSIRFVSVDVDQAAELKEQYGVETTPTVIVFRDGEPVKRWENVKLSLEYMEFLDRQILEEEQEL